MNEYQKQVVYYVLYIIDWGDKRVATIDWDFLLANTRPLDIQDELDTFINMNYN